MELMKGVSVIKFILFIQYINIFCEVNITEIFYKSYSKLKYLPVESTIYYSRNIKCMSYVSNSTIYCLIYDKLYKTIEGKEYYLLTDIPNYSESYYYDITYVKYGNYKGCLLYYFSNTNTVTIYTLFESNNKMTTQNPFNYYNESMNPINNFINCHYLLTDDTIKCFYINKTKDLIKMDMKVNANSNSITATFTTAKFKDSNFIDNNTIIMTSIINDNKYKYFFL